MRNRGKHARLRWKRIDGTLRFWFEHSAAIVEPRPRPILSARRSAATVPDEVVFPAEVNWPVWPGTPAPEEHLSIDPNLQYIWALNGGIDDE